MLKGGLTHRRLRLLSGILACALAVVAACGDGGDGDEADADGGAATTTVAEAGDGGGGQGLPADTSWVAQARGSRGLVYAGPDPDAAPMAELPNPYENGAPLTFLVDGTDVSGDWIPVFLPVPPNGTRGWVQASEVALFADPYRITVDLGAHTLTVTNAGEVTVEAPVAVGDSGWETPTGTYYLKELLQPPDPNGPYGPYAYGISGFSTPDAADAMGIDGPGVIGIHGTNQPELLGTDVSHGCIRVNNTVITQLADYLPLGTPVDIVA